MYFLMLTAFANSIINIFTVLFFKVQLTDASGQRITNIEDFRWVVESTLTYKDSSFTTQTLMSRTSSMSVLNSNPVEITLPATTSEGTQAYYSNIEVSGKFLRYFSDFKPVDTH